MTSRSTSSRRRCIPCIATQPSSRSARAPQQPQPPAQDYDEQPRSNTPTSRSRTRRAMTMRCMGGSKPASTTISAIRPIRTIPTPIRASYEEEPAPKKRSSGLMTVAAVLALAVVGTGAAFAYRTFVGSPRSRRAADHQGRQQPDQGGAGAVRCGRGQDPRPHAVGRWRREAGVARRDAGRRQFEVRRAARGVSAAEPERQPAAGRQCFSVGADGCGRQRHDAEQRAAQDQDARRQGRRRRQRRHPGRRQRAAEAGAAEALLPPPRLLVPSMSRRRATRHPPMPAPIRRCRSRRRADKRPMPRRRPAWPRPIRPRRAARSSDQRWLSGSGLLAEERGRRAGFVPGAAGQVPERARSALVAGDQAGRSRRRRASTTAPWSARSARRGGRSVLQQPEIRRRTVLRPKELTAVSLTRVL